MAATRAPLQGPSTAAELAEIELQGKSYDRGVQYGQAMTRRLEAFYYWFVKTEPRDLLTAEYRAVLEEMEEMTSRHFPQLLEEIKGQTDGSRLPYNWLRIMAFHNEVKYVVSPGCSNVVVTRGPEGPWLARNCDLFEDERSWQILRTARCDDCWSYVGVGYMGLPGVVGVNAAGLAVGGASSATVRLAKTQGMPNLLAYLFATQNTVSGCLERVKALGQLGKGTNIVLLDASGDAAVLEMGAGKLAVRRADESGLLAATNHSVSGEIPPPVPFDERTYESSKARYERLIEMVGSVDPDDRGPELAHRALGDHEGKFPICRHEAGWYNTIYSTVALPGRSPRRLDVCWGTPCTGHFRTYVLPAEGTSGEGKMLLCPG